MRTVGCPGPQLGGCCEDYKGGGSTLPHLPFPLTSEPANMEECGPRGEALLMGAGLQDGRHRSWTPHPNPARPSPMSKTAEKALCSQGGSQGYSGRYGHGAFWQIPWQLIPFRSSIRSPLPSCLSFLPVQLASVRSASSLTTPPPLITCVHAHVSTHSCVHALLASCTHIHPEMTGHTPVSTPSWVMVTCANNGKVKIS